jgi:YVTN family beta-propeller protein
MNTKLMACVAGILLVVAGALVTTLDAFTGRTTVATSGASTPTSGDVYVPVVMRDHETIRGVPDGYPSWGAPIATSPVGEAAWVVNPDAGSVTMVDTGSLEKIAEVPVGQEPWSLAISPDGRSIYVVDRAGDWSWTTHDLEQCVRRCRPVPNPAPSR